MHDVFKPAMRLGLFATVAAAMVAAPALLGHPLRSEAASQVADQQKILVRYEATALMKPTPKAATFASAAREMH